MGMYRIGKGDSGGLEWKCIEWGRGENVGLR